MKRITINVKGMSCQHCVKTVQDALQSLDFVEQVQVNLSGGTADITCSTDTVDLGRIKDVLSTHGYEMTNEK